MFDITTIVFILFAWEAIESTGRLRILQMDELMQWYWSLLLVWLQTTFREVEQPNYTVQLTKVIITVATDGIKNLILWG